MSPEAFHEIALGCRGAEYAVKWRDERVYTVGGKMFAIGGRLGEACPRYRFKASPMTYELLIACGRARPAPYLARAQWVEVMHDALSDEDLSSYLTEAHALVAQTLSRACRAALGLDAR